MRAGALAGGTAVVLYAQIAFSRLADGLQILVHHELATRVPDVHHADRVVRAVVETCLAADAGHGIDHHLARERLAVDCARRTADHANRVRAVHAGIGDHEPATGRSVPEKTRVVLVR